MSRKPIVGGNWKCNPAKLADAKALLAAWKEKAFDKEKVEVVIAPTALHLGHVKSPLEGLGMQVCSQNVGKNDMGAFTGEWTASHLQDMEVGYTLIGHSERRSKYGETDEDRSPELCSGSEDKDEEEQVVRISEITPNQVRELLPPVLRGPGVQDLFAEVKRPHLWLQHDDQDFLGLQDCDGGCGELFRDLTLIPSRTRDVGLMVRKARRFRRGFLLDGHKGTGKSQVLNLLAMWARKNGWLVVLEPCPGRYSREIAEIKRSNNGVYIQSEFAQQFLEAMSLANRLMLEEMGRHLKVTRRLYEPLIQKTVDTEVEAEGLGGVEELKRIASYRRQVRIPSMVDVMPDPQNVWEIVEFGLENPDALAERWSTSEEYAVQAVAETFVQLQRQRTHPVLVVVDAWNDVRAAKEYVSIRYDNTRFNGYIPAKLCATSWQRSNRRDYRPELLGVQAHQIRTVRNFTQQEFANYVMYLRLMKVLHNFPAEDLEYFYMLTQGNGFQARKRQDTALKVEKCQEAGLKVIFCIGELLEEREGGKTDEVNKRQLAAIIPKVKNWDQTIGSRDRRASVDRGGRDLMVIAYEPVWAIGTGKVATPDQAEETQAAIRAYLKEAVSAEVADKVRIQYGGSVTPENCKELITKPNIDGFLVGGASLKPSFMEIVTAVQG
eukprot:g24642.t1